MRRILLFSFSAMTSLALYSVGSVLAPYGLSKGT
jgi:hypothetical protein